MKNSIISIVFAAAISIGSASAQTLSSFKAEANKPDSTFSSRLKITEHGTAASALRAMEVTPKDNVVRGYRVSIYIGNSQNARSVSESEMNRFKELFPDIPVYRNYKIPDFKVTVGNCLNAEEAIIIWGRVKGAFDRASVVREEIPLSLFIKQGDKKREYTTDSGSLPE